MTRLKEIKSYDWSNKFDKELKILTKMEIFYFVILFYDKVKFLPLSFFDEILSFYMTNDK